jgi:hypothetical protein
MVHRSMISSHMSFPVNLDDLYKSNLHLTPEPRVTEEAGPWGIETEAGYGTMCPNDSDVPAHKPRRSKVSLSSPLTWTSSSDAEIA